jgi:hypothetical protein
MPPKGRRKTLDVAKAEKPPDVSEALWRAVPEMARIAKGRGWGRPEIATAAGVRETQVSKWIARKNTPEFGPVQRFEAYAGLEPGSLTRLPGELGKKVTPQAVLDAAEAVGLDPTVIDHLAGKTVSEVAELTDDVKRAVLGVVHILGYSLEMAAKAGRQAQKEHPGLEASPSAWIEFMRPILAKLGPPGSGTFPSSGKIKLG